jgi:precorrin-6Y C5,15-methyltransferase (decarboxylating)
MDGAAMAPGAAEVLARAGLVVGGRRQLEAAGPHRVDTVELGKLEPALDRLAEHERVGGHAVVLASGDPGYFGVLRALRQRGIPACVLPSVSSVQRLAAMIGRPWDDVTVVSAHGRALAPALNVCRARPSVAVLTAPGAGPAEIGAGLHGWQRTLFVAEDLGGPGERLSTVDPEDAAGREWREPNLVFCLADPDQTPERGWHGGGEPEPPPGGWALGEDRFVHRDGMITKSEVRALALARLAPRPGSMVWDVGAGSGSVGVECARLGAAVLAVERDPDQCERITANARAFGVDVRVVPGSAPGVLDGLPQPDAVFVGGGGAGVLADCARLRPQRIVVALAALDSVTSMRDELREQGYLVDGCQLYAARLADLPNSTTRLAATNPVFLLCADLAAEQDAEQGSELGGEPA